MHTEIVRQHPLVLQRILSAYRNDRSKRTESSEAFGLALFSTPLHLPFEDMEHGNNIAQAAIEISRFLSKN